MIQNSYNCKLADGKFGFGQVTQDVANLRPLGEIQLVRIFPGALVIQITKIMTSANPHFKQGRPTAGEPSDILQCFISESRMGKPEVHDFLPRGTEPCAHFPRGEIQHVWNSPREKLDMRVCLMFPRVKSTPVPFLLGEICSCWIFPGGVNSCMWDPSSGEFPKYMNAP
jgi:hypothetical protein